MKKTELADGARTQTKKKCVAGKRCWLFLTSIHEDAGNADLLETAKRKSFDVSKADRMLSGLTWDALSANIALHHAPESKNGVLNPDNQNN